MVALVVAALLPAAVASSAGVNGGATASRVANRSVPIQVGPLVTALPRPIPTIDEVLVQINAARKQRGLAPFTWNTKVAVAAQNQADYVAAIGYVVHAGPNSSSAGDRLSGAGFAWTRFGEALGSGYDDANRMVQGWLNSPSHRAVILGRFSYVGIGRGIDAANESYFAVVTANGG